MPGSVGSGELHCPRADVIWERPTKTVRCVDCPSDVEIAGVVPRVETEPTAVAPASDPDAGVARSSGPRE